MYIFLFDVEPLQSMTVLIIKGLGDRWTVCAFERESQQAIYYPFVVGEWREIEQTLLIIAEANRHIVHNCSSTSPHFSFFFFSSDLLCASDR